MARITPQEAILRLKPSPTRGRFMAPSLNLQSSLTFDKAVGEKELLYVINNENTGESYLCPADDLLYPIIGIWNIQNNNEEIPPNMKDWIKCQEEEIKLLLEEGYSEGDGDPIPSGGDVITNDFNDGEGLLGWSQWNLGKPYNGKVYMYDNISKSYNTWQVGCPAMSLSQIFYYWGNKKGYTIGCEALSNYYRYTKWYEESEGKFSTNTAKINIKINETGTLPKVDNFDFQNMQDSIPKNISKTSPNYLAIATLIQYTVISVKTLPGTLHRKSDKSWYIKNITGSSGASTKDTFEGILKFGFKNVEGFSEASNWEHYTNSSWEDTLTQSNEIKEGMITKILREIENQCPVILSGWTENGGGHTWICDGYKEVNNIKYGHFNWGWGNCYNGWFRLSNLSPGAGIENYSHNSGYNSREYNINRTILIGIHPDGYVPDTTLYGDVNKDGTVDDNDVIYAVKLVYNGNYVKEGDIDKNGIFSELDIEGVYDKVTNPNDLSTKINYVYKIKRLTNDIVNTLLDINTNLRQK